MRNQRTHADEAAQPRQRQSSLTPEQRSQIARMGAHALHAKRDPRETTRKARQAFLDRFERQVDPDGLLEPAERARRADQARSAYFAHLSYRGVRARQRRRAERTERGDAQ